MTHDTHTTHSARTIGVALLENNPEIDEKRDLRARRYAVDPLAQKAHAFARNENATRGKQTREAVLWGFYLDFYPSFINKLNK